jgi:hypothetical protein
VDNFMEIDQELEDKVIEFLQDRVENGPWEPHDIPRVMVRYGLQNPEAFVAEMRERMKQQQEEDEVEDPYIGEEE